MFEKYKFKSASGADLISNEFLVNLPKSGHQYLANFFTKILVEELVLDALVKFI